MKIKDLIKRLKEVTYESKEHRMNDLDNTTNTGLVVLFTGMLIILSIFIYFTITDFLVGTRTFKENQCIILKKTDIWQNDYYLKIEQKGKHSYLTSRHCINPTPGCIDAWESNEKESLGFIAANRYETIECSKLKRKRND